MIALLITDEIYEHIIFDAERHVPPITIPAIRERCVLINSLSKTYSVTGWRVGWVIAAPELTASIRKVHDFLTVGAAAPLQAAGVTALGLPDRYYVELARNYETKRDLLLGILEGAGFHCYPPKGAYYIMCDISAHGFSDDVAFCRPSSRRDWRGGCPGIQFLCRSGGRREPDSLLFRQKSGDLGSSWTALASANAVN